MALAMSFLKGKRTFTNVDGTAGFSFSAATELSANFKKTDK